MHCAQNKRGLAGGLALVFCATAALTGCDAYLGTRFTATEVDSASSGNNELPDNPGLSDLLPCEPGPLSTMKTRLLTKTQWKNSLQRIFAGAPLEALDTLPPEDVLGGYVVGTSVVDELRMSAMLEVSSAVGAYVGEHFSAVMPDCSDPGDAACAEGFIVTYGRLLYRRTLTQEEVTELLSLYEETAQSVSAVTEALLLSGASLYHVEPEVDEEEVIVGAEMATKLSLLLWNDTPTDELLSAAEAGELDTDEGVQLWAEKMLSSDQAKKAISSFYEQWLGFQSRQSDPELSREAATELSKVAEEITLSENSTFADFFTTTRSFVGTRLADVYELEGDFTEPEWVELDGETRAGLLTRAAFLLDTGEQSSPTVRGHQLRERIMCQSLPELPGNVEFPPFQESLTPREFVEYHLTEPSCAFCHELMDPIGLGFEQYDEVGRFRAEYPQHPGVPIDPAGEIVVFEPTDVDGAFSSIVDLSETLSESETARGCFNQQWYRFALGRELYAADTCELSRLAASFAEKGHSPRAFLLDLVKSPGFRLRQPQNGALQ